MVGNTYSKWGVRLGTFALWLALGGSVVYWGLRLSVPPGGVPVPPVAGPAAAIDAEAVARALGAGSRPTALAASQAPVPADGRLVLQGVLAGQAQGSGAALIAVDGQPPRPFRVGAAVGDLVLLALGPREARLGPRVDGPVSVTLEVPVRR